MGRWCHELTLNSNDTHYTNIPTVDPEQNIIKIRKVIGVLHP